MTGRQEIYLAPIRINTRFKYVQFEEIVSFVAYNI